MNPRMSISINPTTIMAVISMVAPLQPREVYSDPSDRAEDLHEENHLNRGNNAHEGRPRSNFLASLTTKLSVLAMDEVGRYFDLR